MRALDKKLMRDLWRLKGQVFAISLIVAGGVAILVMSLSTLASLKASQSVYYERNRLADVFATLKRAPVSLTAKISAVPGVRRVETRIARDVTLDVAGMSEPATGRVISLPERGAPVLNDVTLLEGRLPRRDSRNEVLVNESFADAHGFELGARFSVLLNGVKRQVRIVGIGSSPEYVYARAPGSIMPDNLRYAVLWMPRQTLEAAFDLDSAFNDVSIALSPHASADRVIDELDEFLDPYGGIGAYPRKDQPSHAFLQSELDQLRTIALIIPPIFIVVAVFLLNVMLSRLVDIERNQIGLLKAFGYTNNEVAYHYLKFAFAVAALGIIIGYGLGWQMARMMIELYTTFYQFPILLYRADPLAFILGGFVCFAVAGLGASRSARRAAMLNPAVAMNPPAPANYATGLLKRFDVTAAFDEPTKMILRHILRWPMHSGSTILGVAAATGLLVATLFSRDSVEKMIELFFYRQAPYDAALLFAEPLESAALSETHRLPGVITAEPSRDVAVRLRHGPREERAVVTGVDASATLKVILDKSSKPFVLPDDGLVISTQIGRELGVTRGSRVTVEALEGRRPKREVFVSAVIEDYIGSPAYMNRAAVNRLMEEGPVISGAYLRVRFDELDDFYARIKELPAVGTVTLQRVALQMFRETINTSQETMMIVYRIIGAAIAAGVVYNSMRVALSERARELASMRVLGFTRYEVSYILVGQSLLLVLVSLPPGCVLGYCLAWLIVQGINTDLFRIPLTISAESYGEAALVVVAAAAVAGFIVRREIDRLDLVGVLKTRD